MMRRVATKVDEGAFWRSMSSRKRIKVPDGVSGTVENVEATISKVVNGFEASNTNVGQPKIELLNFSALEVRLQTMAIRVSRGIRVGRSS